MDIVAGGQPLPKDPLPVRHSFGFGEWYDSQKNPVLVGDPHWQKIIEPHSQVHAKAQEAVAALRAGHADKTLEAARGMHKESCRTIEALDAVSANLRRRPGNEIKAALGWKTKIAPLVRS